MQPNLSPPRTTYCQVPGRMKERVAPLILISLLVTCRPALAIPPPWELEQLKANADVILIAKMTRAEPVKNFKRVNRRIGFEPIEVLKGRLSQKVEGAGKVLPLYLLYSQPQPPQGAIRGHTMGVPDAPRPRQGETALIFLKKLPAKEGYFTVVLGKFGYIRLSAATKEERAAVHETIGRHRQWCTKIRDATVRQAMDGYYRKALARAGPIRLH